MKFKFFFEKASLMENYNPFNGYKTFSICGKIWVRNDIDIDFDSKMMIEIETKSEDLKNIPDEELMKELRKRYTKNQHDYWINYILNGDK